VVRGIESKGGGVRASVRRHHVSAGLCTRKPACSDPPPSLKVECSGGVRLGLCTIDQKRGIRLSF
jgi:hypothetical protein